MGIVKETLDALGVTFRNFFRKAVTIQYPRVRRTLPERFRGIPALTTNPETGEENCIACGLCKQICPSKAIEVVAHKVEGRPKPKVYTLDLGVCLFCELCVQVCPNDSIVMIRNIEFPALSREDLVLEKEKLLEVGRNFEISARGSLLMKFQRPRREKIVRTEKKKEE